MKAEEEREREKKISVNNNNKQQTNFKFIKLLPFILLSFNIIIDAQWSRVNE